MYISTYYAARRTRFTVGLTDLDTALPVFDGARPASFNARASNAGLDAKTARCAPMPCNALTASSSLRCSAAARLTFAPASYTFFCKVNPLCE